MKTHFSPPPPTSSTILLVDEHRSTSHLLEHFLNDHPSGYQVVARCRSGEEALKACAAKAPDLVIMDLSIHYPAPREFIIRLRKLESGTRILVYSRWLHPDLSRSLIAAGVHGIIFKEDRLDSLCQAIQTLIGGGYHFSPAIEMPLLEGKKDTASLTEREQQALCLIADGFSTKEMADVLGVSVKTAEKYRERMMSKLNLHDAVRLTHYAIRSGLVALQVSKAGGVKRIPEGERFRNAGKGS